MNVEKMLWVESHRPHKISDVILPKNLKEVFEGIVANGFVDNMTFVGGPGIGKTTVARALLEELDCDYLFKNASLEGNIDTLRTDIMQFASSVSLSGGRKYVILDEADRMTLAAQEGLRGFIEEFSTNCGFILTGNNRQRIIDAIYSRCPPIDFTIPKGEKASLAKQFFSRVIEILKSENVEFDKNVVIEVIHRHFPDWRRILGDLQRYSRSGKIDSGMLTETTSATASVIMRLVKEKSFTGMRKALAENSDIDYAMFYRHLYDAAYDYFDPKFVPQFVVMLGDSIDELSRSVDPEITLAKFLTMTMLEAEFK